MIEPVQNRSVQAFSPETLLSLLIPLLGLAAFTALLAALAVFFGWFPQEMILIGVIAGTLVLAAVSALAYLRVQARNSARHELSEAQSRLGSVIETAMDAIVAVNQNQHIVLFNASAEKVFGYTRAQILGQPLECLLPERHRAGHAAHILRFGTTGVTNRRMGDQTVLMGLRADGEEFPLEASISQHGEPGNKIFTAILRDITTRMRAQEALELSRQELHDLTVTSQTAREQEKSRVARELHDEIGGALTALMMDTKWLCDRLPSANAELSGKLAAMQKNIDNTLGATRRIAADLRPMMLDDLGFEPAIEWLTQDFQKRTGIHCELAIAVGDIEIEGERATALFRILQEALTNITRHARASKVEVTVEVEETSLLLTIRDNGRGFDTEGPRAPRSFGLVGMRERVYLLGGAIRIESTPTTGTLVEARLPVAARETNP